jgi:hypothetical protein
MPADSVPGDVAAELEGFTSRLATDDAVRGIVRSSGGLHTMFESLGGPKDPQALRSSIELCGVPLPGEVQQAMFNRFSLDRYLRTSNQRHATAFGDLLAAATESAHGAILLDTYEEIHTLDPWVRRTLLPALPRELKLVVLGRNKLTEQNLDWSENTDDMRMRALPELARRRPSPICATTG